MSADRAPETPVESGGLRSTSPGWALAVMAMISTCGFIDRIVMNVLAQPIKMEFQLTDTEVGLLAGFAFAVLNVLLGVWIARVAERRRRLTLIGIGTFLWSLATAACGAVTTFSTLVLARIGVGVGEAVGLPATSSVISDYFPKDKRTTAMSVLLLAPPVGAFLGSAGGATIAQIYGWRTAFIVAAAPGLILALLVYFTVAEPKRGRFDDLGAAGDTVPPFSAVLSRMWRRRAFRHLLAGSTIASMVGFGLNSFLAAFLLRKFGYSVAEAGIMAGVIASFPATFSVVGAGWLADRMAKRDARSYGLIPAISLVITTPLYILAITRDTPMAALTLLGVATIFQYTYLAPSQGVFQNMMHPRMRASSAAVTSMIYSLVGAGLGPLLVGSLSDYFAPANTGPQGSADGLAMAMAVSTLIYLWSAAHFFWSTRTIREELSLPL